MIQSFSAQINLNKFHCVQYFQLSCSNEFDSDVFHIHFTADDQKWRCRLKIYQFYAFYNIYLITYSTSFAVESLLQDD